MRAKRQLLGFKRPLIAHGWPTGAGPWFRIDDGDDDDDDDDDVFLFTGNGLPSHTVRPLGLNSGF